MRFDRAIARRRHRCLLNVSRVLRDCRRCDGYACVALAAADVIEPPPAKFASEFAGAVRPKRASNVVVAQIRSSDAAAAAAAVHIVAEYLCED